MHTDQLSVKAIFDEAVEIEDAEEAAGPTWSELCGRQPEIRRKVDALLHVMGFDAGKFSPETGHRGRRSPTISLPL